MSRAYLVAISIVLTLAANESVASGLQQLTVPDPADRAFTIGIWYPSEMSGKRLPLVLISHGNGGSFTSHSDTALALAEAGFVVATVTHTGDNAEDETAAASRWMVDRPRHLRLLLDYMLAKWPEHARIDPARIGVFGFSAGGYTALVAIGGVPDAKRAIAHCAVDPDELLCRLGATRDFNDPAVAARLATGWKRDSRIRAAVIAAPGFGFAFDPDSLAKVTIPIQLWAAADDRNVPYASNTAIVRASLGVQPDFHEVASAGHYAFLQPCPAKLAALPIGAKICADASGFDRGAFHHQFNDSVVAFFLKHLSRQTN